MALADGEGMGYRAGRLRLRALVLCLDPISKAAGHSLQLESMPGRAVPQSPLYPLVSVIPTEVSRSVSAVTVNKPSPELQERDGSENRANCQELARDGPPSALLASYWGSCSLCLYPTMLYKKEARH